MRLPRLQRGEDAIKHLEASQLCLEPLRRAPIFTRPLYQCVRCLGAEVLQLRPIFAALWTVAHQVPLPGILKAYLGCLPPGSVHNLIGPCTPSINPRLEHTPYGHTATIQCLNVWTLSFFFGGGGGWGEGSHLLACGSLVP